MYEPENDRGYDPMNTQRGTGEDRRSVGEFAASGEYHFTRGESTRVGYSDAGYVPTSEASEIPPRYHYTEPPAAPPRMAHTRQAAIKPLRPGERRCFFSFVFFSLGTEGSA